MSTPQQQRVTKLLSALFDYDQKHISTFSGAVRRANELRYPASLDREMNLSNIRFILDKREPLLAAIPQASEEMLSYMEKDLLSTLQYIGYTNTNQSDNPLEYLDPDGRSPLSPISLVPLVISLLKAISDSASAVAPQPPTISTPTATPVPTSEPVVPGQGEIVYTQRSGTVFRSGWQDPDNHDTGMGWRTSINTNDGYYDQYGHLDPDSTLPAGTVVEAGDPIGRMADPSNGHTTGPHVHVERRRNDGSTVDPGNVSPFAGPSRITDGYGTQEEGLRQHPHTGVDHVPE